MALNPTLKLKSVNLAFVSQTIDFINVFGGRKKNSPSVIIGRIPCTPIQEI